MKLIVSVAFLLFTVSSGAIYSQIETIPQFQRSMVILRTVESSNLFVPSRLFITDGYGVEHTQELKYSASGKSITENSVVIANVINQLMEQGFELISSNGATQGGESAPIIGNYIFRKPK